MQPSAAISIVDDHDGFRAFAQLPDTDGFEVARRLAAPRPGRGSGRGAGLDPLGA